MTAHTAVDATMTMMGRTAAGVTMMMGLATADSVITMMAHTEEGVITMMAHTEEGVITTAMVRAVVGATMMAQAVEGATMMAQAVEGVTMMAQAVEGIKVTDLAPLGGGGGGQMSPELKAAVENARQDRVELQNAPEDAKAQCAEACKNSEAEVVRLGGNPGMIGGQGHDGPGRGGHEGGGRGRGGHGRGGRDD